jgi:hypothetical protein
VRVQYRPRALADELRTRTAQTKKAVGNQPSRLGRGAGGMMTAPAAEAPVRRTPLLGAEQGRWHGPGQRGTPGTAPAPEDDSG